MFAVVSFDKTEFLVAVLAATVVAFLAGYLIGRYDVEE